MMVIINEQLELDEPLSSTVGENCEKCLILLLIENSRLLAKMDRIKLLNYSLRS